MSKKILLFIVSFSLHLNALALTIANDTKKDFFLKAVSTSTGMQCLLNDQSFLPIPGGRRIGNIKLNPTDCQLKNQLFISENIGGKELACTSGSTSYTILGTENRYHCRRRL